MPQYLLQAEDISTVHQVVISEDMPEGVWGAPYSRLYLYCSIISPGLKLSLAIFLFLMILPLP